MFAYGNRIYVYIHKYTLIYILKKIEETNRKIGFTLSPRN